jgi:hypothetical protein
MAGIRKAYDEFSQGFRDDYGIGGEDARRVMHRTRELQGKTAEGPKMELMAGSHPLIQRVRDVTGHASEEGLQARAEAGMELKDNKSLAHQSGQVAGSVAADLTQDTSRRFYWLLNALQASGEVINETVLAAANKASKIAPDLYGKHDVLNSDGVPIGMTRVAVKKDGKPSSIEMRVERNSDEAAEAGIIKEIDNQWKAARGYSWNDESGRWQQRNFEPGHVQSLAIPSGIAINAGLGLMSPFGGAEGYKAALPSEEDPTKTENLVGEVAMKYIMGRTGTLLPYNEFKQVRPDVSPGEYNAYQAFKYDKNTDLNPLDGDVTILGGGLKATDEGIHGPEVQFLGRGLPVTTGIVPFASAVAGGAMGVRGKRPIKGGFVGGLAGLAVGQVAGNLLEGERRRRNAAENGIQL